MIRLAIAGACGRMGQRIGALAAANGQFKIVGVLESSTHPWLGRDYGQCLGIGDLGVALKSGPKEVLAGSDVLVDFAIADAVSTHIQAAKEARKPFVLGTTGLGAALIDQVKEASKVVACVMSPNMSPGINLLLDIVRSLCEKLGTGYDIEIVEKHHRMKKDWPSGTALKLAEAIAQGTGRKISKDGKARLADEIVVHTVRGGDIVGDHTVLFAGDGEVLEITHRATSRDTFAMGALRAAKFVTQAKPGLYSMLDVMRAGLSAGMPKE